MAVQSQTNPWKEVEDMFKGRVRASDQEEEALRNFEQTQKEGTR